MIMAFLRNLLVLVLVLCKMMVTSATSSFDPDLPASHLPMFYRQFPNLKPDDWEEGREKDQCWGYEDYCERNSSAGIECNQESFSGLIKTKAEAEETFFNEADFGYVKERRAELRQYCLPSINKSSSLVCSKHLQFCEGEGMMIDLRGIEDRVHTENLRYRMDVLSEGEMGINCQIDHQMLKEELQYVSPLQSWAPEFRNIRESDETISGDSPTCDLYIDQPTFIVKLDATVNMYHHFCDFLNLYLSLHVRKTEEDGTKMFSTDNQIIIWENHDYISNFGDAWRAFSRNPLLNLLDLAGKRVCFRNVVFPLLSRMLFGLYYNTPLIRGCANSALFTSFSQFVLHRLEIPAGNPTNKLRVTLLSRRTRFRRILNEDELVASMEASGRFTVTLAKFDHRTPFTQQLEVIRSTDILIGMHGAGLTHLLFLPAWAAVFELYHCDDPECYNDLARLQGLKYTTWQNMEKLTGVEVPDSPYSGPAHQKFRNYKFDVVEFLTILLDLETKVKRDERYSAQQEESFGADNLDRTEERWEGRIEPLTNRNGQTKEFAAETLNAQDQNARHEL